MDYLLDSNTISELYDVSSIGHAMISGHLGALTDLGQVYISILALYELEYGWANAPHDKKAAVRQVILDVQRDFRILPLSSEGTRMFGELKKMIKDTRSPSKDNMKKFNINLMLAATAMTEQCTLVSADSPYETLTSYQPTFQVINWLK